MEEPTQLELAGYELLTQEGFALACYGHRPRPNQWFRAISSAPGARDAKIERFERYEPEAVQHLPEAQIISVGVGDPWSDVFRWNDSLYIGTERELWRALQVFRKAMLATAPITLLDLCPRRSFKQQRRYSAEAFNYLAIKFGEERARNWREELHIPNLILAELRRAGVKVNRDDFRVLTENDLTRVFVDRSAVKEGLEGAMGGAIDTALSRVAEARSTAVRFVDIKNIGPLTRASFDDERDLTHHPRMSMDEFDPDAFPAVEDIWAQVGDLLREEFGSGIDPWLLEVRMEAPDFDQAHLVVPSAKIRDLVKKRYWSRTLALWGEYDALGRKLTLRAEKTSLLPRSAKQQRLQDRLRFETLNETAINPLAAALAQRLAEWSDEEISPVVFYGPSGSGKTHLLQAIACRARRLAMGRRVVYLDKQSLTALLAEAAAKAHSHALEAELSDVDLLIIDDLDRAPLRPEILLTTLEGRGDKRRRVVVSSRLPPAKIETAQPLRQILIGGLTCAVKRDRPIKLDQVRRAALQLQKQLHAPHGLPNDVLAYVAERARLNGDAEVEAELRLLQTLSMSRPIEFERAFRILSKHDGTLLYRGDLDTIVAAVARRFSISTDTILGSSRERDAVQARQSTMWLISELTDRSLPEIGSYFGRDHSTVLHAIQRIDNERRENESLGQRLKLIMRALRNEPA